MRFPVHLFLLTFMALAPLGCNRDYPHQYVSANSDKAVPPAQTAQKRQNPSGQPQPRSLARRTETVPAGSRITVVLDNAISTDANKQGGRFTARLSQPIVKNGKVLAEKGAPVAGHIAKLEEPGRIKGRAQMVLQLDQIRLGKATYKLPTQPFTATAESSHTRDAAEIGGGAAAGAIIGAITGGGKGAAIGAAAGGGAGTAVVLATKGKQLTLPAETRVNFNLAQPLTLPVVRNTNT